jgi:hypothetical protein
MGQDNKKCCVTHDFYTRKTVLLRLYGSVSINGLMVVFRKLKRLPVAERSLPSAAKHSIGYYIVFLFSPNIIHMTADSSVYNIF